MELKLLKCDWGMEYLGDMPARLEAYAAAGYDGVECSQIGMDPDTFGELLELHGLDYVAMMFCDDETAFRQQLDAVKRTRPLLINCHPGRDWFDLERSVRFFSEVKNMAEEVMDYEKVAIITEENDWNIGMLEVIEQELGEKIVSNEVFEKGSKDIRNTILKALKSEPDVLLLNPNSGPTSGTLFKQLAEVKDQLEDIDLVSQLLVYLKEDMRTMAPELSSKIKIVEAALLDDPEFQNFKASAGDIVNYTEFLTANTHNALLNLVLAHRRSVANETDVLSELRNNPLQGFVTSGSQFNDDTFLGGVEFSTFVLEDGQIIER